ncbi:MAG: VOC family protein [Polyangia bacterium]
MNPTPKGWPRISSSLYYEDPHRAIEWLQKAFGFELRLKIEGDAGQVMHSELTYGEGLIMVSGKKDNHAEGKYPFFASPRDVGGKNTQNMMVYVDDIEAHHACAVAGGAKVIDPISLHDYGEAYWADRSYGCSDYEGHHWWFTQRIRG